MSDSKDCPFCAETIKAAAKFCRWCRNSLDEPKEPARVAELTVLTGSAEDDAKRTADEQTISQEDVVEAADAFTDEERQSSGGLGEIVQDVRDVQQALDPDGSKLRGAISFLESISLKRKKA